MTRKNVTLALIIILVVGLAIGVTACTKKAVKEVPKEEVITKEIPVPSLEETVKAIQEGKIDVGKDYGMATGQRYHNIHANVLKLECANCHISGQPNPTQTVFNAQDVSPQAPAPVDKQACLVCHSTGPAKAVYGSGQ